MNKRLLIIPFIVGVLVLQFANTKLNEYQQRIEQMQNNIETIENKANKLETEVKNNNNRINEIHTSRGIPRTLEIVATAYTYTGDNTTSGTWPEPRKTIAVDPSVIPLNSLVYVESESEMVGGLYVAEDTGRLIKNNKIDVFMSSEELANSFGIQRVKVTVLKYGGNS